MRAYADTELVARQFANTESIVRQHDQRTTPSTVATVAEQAACSPPAGQAAHLSSPETGLPRHRVSGLSTRPRATVSLHHPFPWRMGRRARYEAGHGAHLSLRTSPPPPQHLDPPPLHHPFPWAGGSRRARHQLVRQRIYQRLPHHPFPWPGKGRRARHELVPRASYHPGPFPLHQSSPWRGDRSARSPRSVQSAHLRPTTAASPSGSVAGCSPRAGHAAHLSLRTAPFTIRPRGWVDRRARHELVTPRVYHPTDTAKPGSIIRDPSRGWRLAAGERGPSMLRATEASASR
jgi:hypothetical protein